MVVLFYTSFTAYVVRYFLAAYVSSIGTWSRHKHTNPSNCATDLGQQILSQFLRLFLLTITSDGIINLFFFANGSCNCIGCLISRWRKETVVLIYSSFNDNVHYVKYQNFLRLLRLYKIICCWKRYTWYARYNNALFYSNEVNSHIYTQITHYAYHMYQLKLYQILTSYLQQLLEMVQQIF